MLVIWFSIGFLVAQFFLGASSFQIIKEDGEIVTMQQRLFDYVSNMNRAIGSRTGEVNHKQVNTVEITTPADFIDSLLITLKLEIEIHPDNIHTVLAILDEQLENQPNIIWNKGKLEIYSKRKSEMLAILKRVDKRKFKWYLTKIEENMR